MSITETETKPAARIRASVDVSTLTDEQLMDTYEGLQLEIEDIQLQVQTDDDLGKPNGAEWRAKAAVAMLHKRRQLRVVAVEMDIRHINAPSTAKPITPLMDEKTISENLRRQIQLGQLTAQNTKRELAIAKAKADTAKAERDKRLSADALFVKAAISLLSADMLAKIISKRDDMLQELAEMEQQAQ